MQKEDALETLQDKNADLERVLQILNSFENDTDIQAQTAMNISRRVSVDDAGRECDPRIIQMLRQLAKSKDMGARWAVAKCVHTPQEILQTLAEDEVNLVRALVATNPNTPAGLLERFFEDDKIVKDGLTGNAKTPLWILQKLADDPDKMVRMRTVQNPSLPLKLVEKMCGDGNKDVSILANEIKQARQGEGNEKK